MISLSALRVYLQRPSSTDPPDAVLTAIEAKVVADLEGRSGFHLGASTTLTHELDGPAYRTPGLAGTDTSGTSGPLWLPELPAAITSVKFRDGAGWGDAETASDFTLEPGGPALRPGRLWYANSWPTGQRAIQVVYDFGFAEDAAPAQADHLVKELVQWYYLQRESEFAKAEKDPEITITRQTWVEAGLGSEIAEFVPARCPP